MIQRNSYRGHGWASQNSYTMTSISTRPHYRSQARKPVPPNKNCRCLVRTQGLTCHCIKNKYLGKPPHRELAHRQHSLGQHGRDRCGSTSTSTRTPCSTTRIVPLLHHRRRACRCATSRRPTFGATESLAGVRTPPPNHRGTSSSP